MSEINETQEFIVEEVVSASDEEIENLEDLPVFYNPVSVLQMDEYLKWTAFIMVAVTFGTSIFSINSMAQNVAIVLTQTTTPNILAWIVTAILFLIIVGASSAVYYFPLRALGNVLKILMEMEYNSRGIKE